MLSAFFKKHNIEWSLITKVFSGDKEFLKHVLTDDVIQEINSVGDSRLTSRPGIISRMWSVMLIYRSTAATQPLAR